MPRRKTAHRRKTRKVIRFKWRNIAIATGLILAYFFFRPVEAQEPMLSPEGTLPEAYIEFLKTTPTPTNTPTPTVTPTPSFSLSGERATQAEKDAVVEYMRQKFGEAFEVAYAVARVEGWPHGEDQGWNRNLCWHRVENGRNKGENSWGIFQINLVQGCNAEGNKVHWNRIPGDTLQEKVEWLSNPFNNIDVAYQIYTEQGFRPWTGYTSGNYRKYL